MANPVVDAILVVLCSPLLVLRVFHYLWTRVIFRDTQADDMVDSFARKYKDSLYKFEIRSGRIIELLDIPSKTTTKRERGFILFAHGSCARMQQFQEQIAYFSEAGYHVCAFDHLGCGLSSKPNDSSCYRTAELFEDFKAILKHFAAKHKVKALCLVGQSLGGAFAAKLSTMSNVNETVTSIVSICPPAPSFGVKLAKANKIFSLPTPILWLIRPLLGIKARELLFGPHAPPALARMEKEASARNPVYMFKAFYSQLDREPASIPHGAHAKVPVLLIAADSDKLCPPEGVEEYVNILGPMAGLKTAVACGHQCMQEDPDQINKMIEDFISTK